MEKDNLRILVVYYSFDGNTKLIAESIVEEIHGDILPLEVEKPIANNKKKYLVGGKQVILKEKPMLIPYEFKAENYDVLFIGTPIWAWNYAPALRTFFAENSIKNKKIVLFSCNGGQNGKTFENMKKALPDNEFLGEIEFYEPLKSKKEEKIELAKSWARKMTS
ncbi:MAG: flavodoxin [Clostridium sp.]|uniref:flavodoxin family protein n=1 Tax=Clostridium sp. TaxID=1506 RepID=UPI0025B90A7A|nr:flavodoxin [Clostridium sp.]MCE5222139.1 flavodoxin [Clostridium sp.]